MAVLKLHRVLSQDGYGGGQSLKCMLGKMPALFVHQYEVNQVIIEPHQHTWGVDHMIGVECINMHWKRTASCTVASSYAGCSVKCNWGQTQVDGVGPPAKPTLIKFKILLSLKTKVEIFCYSLVGPTAKPTLII